MPFKNLRHIWLLIAAAAFFACEADIEQHKPHAGDIDLSTYVALGNSLTAGFTDGELFREGQKNAYPNILAQQMKHAGLPAFHQPLMKDELGFGNRLILASVGGNLLPVPASGTPDPGNMVSIANEGPFHNLGVPGAKTAHLLAQGYGSLNPYYGRFASDPASSSLLGEALALQSTFFSLWIGNNDVLGFALSGGEGDGITPVEDFQMFYQAILGQLTSSGAKGVVANIPDITSIPFFNTVPYNVLVLQEQAQVDALNAAYSIAPHIEFSLGPNGLVVADATHPAGIRQLVEGEAVLLTALPGISGAGWGSQAPMQAPYYLSNDQLSQARAAVDAYNAFIRQLANDLHLAHVDVHTLLREAETGMFYDAIAFNTAFVTGGVFSLDGVHLSARGNAIVANEFIKAINSKYNATIPTVPVSMYPGIIFP